MKRAVMVWITTVMATSMKTIQVEIFPAKQVNRVSAPWVSPIVATAPFAASSRSSLKRRSAMERTMTVMAAWMRRILVGNRTAT